MIRLVRPVLQILSALAVLTVASPAFAKPDDGLCVWLKLDKAATDALSAQPPTSEILVAHQADFLTAMKACGIAKLDYQMLGDQAATQYWGAQLAHQGISITTISGNWRALPTDTKKRFDGLLVGTAPIAGDDLTFVQDTLKTIERNVGPNGEADDSSRQAVFSWLSALAMLARDEGA